VDAEATLRYRLITLLLVLGITTPARADVSPLLFVFDGYFCIGAIFFAIAVWWSGVWLARRSARKNRQYLDPPHDDGESSAR
jgi:hypothetical protein